MKDGYRIRLAAEQRRIPCCTSLDTAAALVDAIGRHTSGQSVRVATVREYRDGAGPGGLVTADLSRAALETGEVLVVEAAWRRPPGAGGATAASCRHRHAGFVRAAPMRPGHNPAAAPTVQRRVDPGRHLRLRVRGGGRRERGCSQSCSPATRFDVWDRSVTASPSSTPGRWSASPAASAALPSHC